MAAPALPELASLILDNLPLGLWVADAKGELLYANAEFQEIMGMGARDDVAVGGYAEPYGICDRSGQPYPESRMPFVQAMQARTTVVVDDIVIHRRDGRRVHVRATARPQLDAGGAVQSVVIAFFDITREVEAERARAHSESQQRHTQRLEALGKLAGGIAHDFNNLLAGIKMLASHVRLGEEDPARLSSLRYIDDITDRGAELTRALLRFAQKESNHPRAVDFDEVIRDTVELAQRTIDRRIEVIADLGAPGATILGHRPQVEQVVMNLVVNARDAIPGAGRLILRTRSGGDHVVLEVEDTGTGIEPHVMARLFEPYVTTKDVGAIKGTGLGLAMVYGIVQSHDGTVEVASTNGESIRAAIKWIKSIASDPEVGQIYDGTVVKVMEFGAFVNFFGAKDGLVHISQLAASRVQKTSDVVKEGDKVKVKLLGFDDRGKTRLSMKVVDQVTGEDLEAKQKAAEASAPREAAGE